MEYAPLDDARDEIRLLALKVPLGPSEMLVCTLKHVSLQDLTAEYKHHTMLSTQTSSLAPWLESPKAINDGEAPKSNGITGQIPKEKDYRFQWGDFAALSYTWGPLHQTRSILLNGIEVQARTNLESALRVLGSTAVFEADYMLWVDALCIDQGDFDERERQVKMMRRLYSTSWAVIGWIGEEGDSSVQALDLLEMLAGIYGDDKRCRALRDRSADDPQQFASGSWVALEKLMLRGYWERLWIIQELALGASKVRIVCGRRSLSWKTFCYGIGTLNMQLWAVMDRLLEHDMAFLATRNSSINAKAATQASVEWKSSENLKHVYKDLWKLSKIQMGEKIHMDLFGLLHLAKSALCQDPRDKVYGLLGLMDPKLSGQIFPDYQTDPRKVFISVASTVVSNSGNLEILREGFAWSKIGVPSWVPDWTWTGRVRDNRPVNNIPIIPYRAAGDVPAAFTFVYDGSHLKCAGYIFDKINGFGAHESSWLCWPEESIVNAEHPTNAYGSAAATREAFYHALIMGRKEHSMSSCGGHECILHLPRYTSGLEQFKKLGWGYFAVEDRFYPRWENWRKANKYFWVGDRYLDEYFTDDIPEGAIEHDYWDAYASWTRSVTGRRLLTSVKGYFGWGPNFQGDSKEEQICVGDLICFVFGCSTPLVVRLNKGGKYQVLGEAYVQGLMNGETLALLKLNPGQVQNIVFC